MIPLGVLGSARRASGAFSADDYTGCTLWLKADAITGKANGDVVDSWPDSAAAANHASRVGSGGATWGPLYVASAVNGLPAVDIIGVGGPAELGGFTSAASASGAEQTIFAVVYVDTVSSTRTIRGASGSGGLQVRVETSGKQGLVKQLVANLGSSTNGVSTGAWKLLTYTYSDSGNEVAFRLAAAANGTASTTASLTASTTTRIGQVFGGEPFDGKIAELITYSTRLNSTQISEVESYLATKYGL